MTDFNWRPGVTDRTGRIGTPANTIAPGKRMLSSQSPTFVARDGKLVLVTGSPGGRTIPNTVLSIVLGVTTFGLDVRQAVDAPRLHHQWLPDVVKFEGATRPEFSSAIETLKFYGHTVDSRGARQGDGHSIMIVGDKLFGAADGRRSMTAKAAAF
jgi:gamma-glutamyltranspeptidase/glutathione hydrolase